ncbi:MAG: hypothetical protein ACR65T_03425 [Methylocystis sp.]|uniref:hypothetical protein n=1 Tax=Methylocystis sp. TaxID=1911079 RepID=UPI003DA521DA
MTEKIVAAKVACGLKWADVAAQIRSSKEWVTAACLGRMTLTAAQAAKLAEILRTRDNLAIGDGARLINIPFHFRFREVLIFPRAIYNSEQATQNP